MVMMIKDGGTDLKIMIMKPVLWIIPADVVVAGNFVVTCVIPAKCIVLVKDNFGFVLVFSSIIYVSVEE